MPCRLDKLCVWVCEAEPCGEEGTGKHNKEKSGHHSHIFGTGGIYVTPHPSSLARADGTHTNLSTKLLQEVENVFSSTNSPPPSHLLMYSLVTLVLTHQCSLTTFSPFQETPHPQKTSIANVLRNTNVWLHCTVVCETIGMSGVRKRWGGGVKGVDC